MINPDKDMQPTGQLEIYSASKSPEGAFLGSISTKRIETLLQAYRNTTSPELGDFPQAIAKLVARYKDGSKSRAHNVAYKNCCTAPPSLTTALIGARGATTVLFARLLLPLQTVEMMNNGGNNAAGKWMAGDLTSALKKAARPDCQAGNANNTLYVDLWTQVESELFPNITEYLWGSPHTTQSILRNVLKARYGQL